MSWSQRHSCAVMNCCWPYLTEQCETRCRFARRVVASSSFFWRIIFEPNLKCSTEVLRTQPQLCEFLAAFTTQHVDVFGRSRCRRPVQLFGRAHRSRAVVPRAVSAQWDDALSRLTAFVNLSVPFVAAFTLLYRHAQFHRHGEFHSLFEAAFPSGNR